MRTDVATMVYLMLVNVFMMVKKKCIKSMFLVLIFVCGVFKKKNALSRTDLHPFKSLERMLDTWENISKRPRIG